MAYTQRHIHTLTYTHSHAHVCAHVHMCARTHARTHTHTHTYRHRHTLVHTCMYGVHTETHTHTYIHTLTCARMCTCACTHTHTHTQTYYCSIAITFLLVFHCQTLLWGVYEIRKKSGFCLASTTMHMSLQLTIVWRTYVIASLMLLSAISTAYITINIPITSW